MNKQEWQDTQQPLDNKSGWENEKFSQFYGQDKNPFKGTERDIKNRKGESRIVVDDLPESYPCPICGKGMFIYQKICGGCYSKGLSK